MSFSNLHVHSMYSTLDGMSNLRELIERAKELGQPSIAITDHGSTSGLWYAQEIGKEVGVKVIHGSEFYYERENDGKNGHLVVLAKNNIGLKNIFKLQEYGYVENFYRKPRINFDKLVEHKEGLIVLSACLASTFSQYIMNGELQEATLWAHKFKDEFGDDFYLEIQPNAMPEQWEVNKHTVKIGKELGIKVVATNDVHYVLEDDSFPHEVLLAMQVNKKMSDPKRWSFTTVDFWLRSKEEMIENFVGISNQDILSALDMTQEISDKCSSEIKPGKFLPNYYDVPEGMTPRELLVKKVIEGAREKGVIKDKEYMKEVQKEIDVIDSEGYSDYFLVVSDYVNSARERGEVVGDGRGSASGSKVIYLLDITRVEPKQFNLLFERFLAPGREPDIDTDFSNQEAVFTDLQEKYGVESVAKIVTFGKMTPKAVCRKVLSTFEVPQHIINSISKSIPEGAKSISDALEESDDFHYQISKYPDELEVIKRLEGTISHEGQHAGGIIIYPNLSDYLPIKTLGEDRNKRIVAFDMDMIHDLHFFKFDVLAVDTISTIKETVDSINKESGTLDLHNIDYDDKNVYEMLSKGQVSGVFQLANQSAKVIEQKPKNFIDLIAINALIRPGIGNWGEYIARRNGKEYELHELRKPYLQETEGIITYQEQFLLDANTFAGWDVAYADKHIRKNKDIKNDNELMNKFLKDSGERGYEIDDMLIVWDEICESVQGGYSFNKSHSASYAMTSFQTAYLKHYYPKHFYASLMSSEKTDADGQSVISGYINEAKQQGISILPPDVNKSTERFVVVEKGIAYRITAIKHIGDSAIAHINELRPIKSFNDFMERREKRYAKVNVIRNLIKAGCFDFDEPNRGELMDRLEASLRTKTQIKEEFQFPKTEYNDAIKSEWEKQVLGLYLSTHPMEKYGFHPIDTFDEGEYILQGGEVSSIKEFKDKNNNLMAFIFIDTLFGNVKLVVFSSTWSEEGIKEQLTMGNMVMVKGKKSGDGMIVNEVEVLN